jgi:hypothetical protein
LKKNRKEVKKIASLWSIPSLDTSKLSTGGIATLDTSKQSTGTLSSAGMTDCEKSSMGTSSTIPTSNIHYNMDASKNSPGASTLESSSDAGTVSSEHEKSMDSKIISPSLLGNEDDTNAVSSPNNNNNNNNNATRTEEPEQQEQQEGDAGLDIKKGSDHHEWTRERCPEVRVLLGGI